MRVAKKLKYPQVIALIDALRSKADDFIARRVSNDEVAIELSKHCGFEITASNVQGAKEALKLSWKIRTPKVGKPMNPTYSILAKAILQIAGELSMTLVDKDKLEAIAAKSLTS